MIVTDVQALQSESFGERGIGRFVLDLSSALAIDHPDAVDAYAWNDALARTPRLEELGAIVGDRLRSFSELRGHHVDVLHVNAPFEMADLAEIAVPVRADRLVVTVYDLIPLRFPDVYLSDPRQRARYLARLALLNAADAIVADSRSAADDLVEMAGVPRNRITVIGAGVADRFRPPTEPLGGRMAQLRERFPRLSARYVLVPTGIDWRKNVEGMIAAFGRLPAEVRLRHQLVLACSITGGQRAWVEDLAHDAGVLDRLVITGHVPDDVLVLLHQTAELVVLPSFYEGFGLPVLEARRCGARVICSASSSLPEVLPDERALFDPWDADAIAARMEVALTDPADTAMLDAVPIPPFSWSAAAERVADVYRSLEAARSQESNRRRLGVVTVLPPTPSGVADHSERLLAALDDEVADLDVVAYADGAAGGTHPVRPTAALATDWAAGRLDAVVYCLGNNRVHRQALTDLRLVPGHVFLHDVRLTTLDEPGRRASVRSAIAGAISVLVQSAHASDLVAAISPQAPVVDIGPHPCQVVGETVPLGDDGLPWVVSAGIAHEVKRSDVVADAFERMAVTGVARVALVGPGGERFAGERVIATGAVADDEFDRWLRRTAVLVQLRRESNGESSGVVAHAMARGIPLVVSDLGAMAELPDEVAVKLAPDVDADGIASAVAQLLGDPDRRDAMRRASLAFAARETPAAQARRLVDAVFR